MAFSNLTPTSTFTQWYTLTNEIGTFLNTQIVANGQVAYGAFAFGANATVNVCNSALYVTANVVAVNTNIDIGTATSYVAFLGDEFTVASNTVLFNPVTSVFVNTAITVNAVATFLANIVANTIVVQGTLIAPSARYDGNVTANNGTLVARQLSFTTNGASVANTMSSVGYADFDQTGLDDATVFNVTPTQNLTISGLQGHVAVTSSTSGARVLYLQNLSDTYTITLSPANSSSTAQHRFETVASLPIDVKPLQSVLLVYSKARERWRVVGGSGTTGGAVAAGNTAISGVLTVTANASFAANVVAAPLYVNQVTGRVGIGTATPSQLFHSTGPSLLEGTTTTSQLVASSLVVSGGANLASANVQVFTNGVVQFSKFINVNSSEQSYIGNLRAGALSCDATITGVTLTGVTGTFAGVVSGATGTFGTLGAISGTSAAVSGALTVGGTATVTTSLLPAADDTALLGNAARRWKWPFMVLKDGGADAGMDIAVITGASGELKYAGAFTGTQIVQTDTGQRVFTYKAGALVSIGPAL